MNRIPSLDGLRAVSISLVFLGHLAGTRHFFSIATLEPLGDLGNLGVRVFFVISGFLITNLLLVELARTQRISLKAFYIRRILRIFPAFYTFLLVIVLLALAGVVTLNRQDVLHAVTYTSNYHWSENFTQRHLWSLAVEEQFYVLWPLVLAMLGVARASWALVGVLMTVPLLRIAMFHLAPESEIFMNTAFERVCDALATGCLLAIFLPELKARRWFIALVSSRAFPLLVVAVLVVNRQVDHPHFLWLLGIPFMNVVVALTIARYVQFPGLPAGRFLNTRPLVAIGVCSYSLYLWQQLFLVQGRPVASPLLVFPFNLIMACVCGFLSYKLIERPFLRLKDRFQTVRAASADGSPAGTDRTTSPALLTAKS